MFGPATKISPSPFAMGIDIGQYALKAILLEATGEGVSVHHAARIPTPAGAVQKGVVTGRREIAAQIAQIVRQTNMPLKSAVLAVPTDQLVVRWVDLPAMDAEALRAAGRFEARKFLPYPVDQAEVALVPIETTGAEENRMRALLVAAPRDVVHSRAETLEMAGLEVARIGIEPFAVVRAMNAGKAARAEIWRGQPIVHVHLGEETSAMCVMQDMSLRFVHAISWGSSRLTQMLATDLDCTLEEARAIKESTESSVDAEGLFAWHSPEGRRVTEALVPEFVRLRREIQRLLNYYRSLFPERSYEGILDRLLLSGGTANLPGLPAFFSQMFQAEVSVRNPFQSFTSHLEAGSFSAVAGHSASFSVAIGLALSELPRETQRLGRPNGEREREFVWRRTA